MPRDHHLPSLASVVNLQVILDALFLLEGIPVHLGLLLHRDMKQKLDLLQSSLLKGAGKYLQPQKIKAAERFISLT